MRDQVEWVTAWRGGWNDSQKGRKPESVAGVIYESEEARLIWFAKWIFIRLDYLRARAFQIGNSSLGCDSRFFLGYSSFSISGKVSRSVISWSWPSRIPKIEEKKRKRFYLFIKATAEFDLRVPSLIDFQRFHHIIRPILSLSEYANTINPAISGRMSRNIYRMPWDIKLTY